MKWPDGFRCPLCENTRAVETRGGRIWACSRGGCRYSESALVRTVFEATKKPLRLWFQAIFLLASDPNGISAKELQRKLELGSYQTAWVWLHKLRISLQESESWIALLNSRSTPPPIQEKTAQPSLAPSTQGMHAWRANLPSVRSAFAFLRSGGNAWNGQGDHQKFIAWARSAFGGRVSYKHLPKYMAEHRFRVILQQPADRVEAVLHALCVGATSYWRILGKVSPLHLLVVNSTPSPGSLC